MEAAELMHLLDEAIRETVGRDRYLFENNAGERTIAARLAISLQSRFKRLVS